MGLASGHGCQGPDAGQQEGSDASQQEDNLRRHPRNISISRLPPHNRENHLAQVKELVASYEEVSESIMPNVKKARKIISEVKTAETSTRICQRGAEETGILGRDIRMHCVGVGDLGEEKVLVQSHKIYLYSKPRQISSSDKCKRDCLPHKRTNQLDQGRLQEGSASCLKRLFLYKNIFQKRRPDHA